MFFSVSNSAPASIRVHEDTGQPDKVWLRLSSDLLVSLTVEEAKQLVEVVAEDLRKREVTA